MKQLARIALSFLFILPLAAHADILLMIHGYQSAGDTWRYHGVTRPLSAYGWLDAGYYAPGPGGVIHHGPAMDNKGLFFVTAELPSEAPVEIQANLLNSYLRAISAIYPEQPVKIVAHSAGGIVARLALVRDATLPVSQLVTVATPHLGTGMAELGEMLADSPLGFFAPLFGADEINRSEHLYSQLGREHDNYFLFWLNRQPHPAISYVSIVRNDGSMFGGDIFVPSYSQDMSNVPAIGPMSRIVLTPGDHELKFADGQVIAAIVTPAKI